MVTLRYLPVLLLFCMPAYSQVAKQIENPPPLKTAQAMKIFSDAIKKNAADPDVIAALKAKLNAFDVVPENFKPFYLLLGAANKAIVGSDEFAAVLAKTLTKEGESKSKITIFAIVAQYPALFKNAALKEATLKSINPQAKQSSTLAHWRARAVRAIVGAEQNNDSRELLELALTDSALDLDVMANGLDSKFVAEAFETANAKRKIKPYRAKQLADFLKRKKGA